MRLLLQILQKKSRMRASWTKLSFHLFLKKDTGAKNIALEKKQKAWNIKHIKTNEKL